MSKLEAYTDKDQQLVRQALIGLVEIQLQNGVVARDNASIKAAMPQGLEMAKALVDTLNVCRAKRVGLDADAQTRVKNLAMALALGALAQSSAEMTPQSVAVQARSSFIDACSTIIAVEEFLCG
jgi:hypothetical protein